jgi:microcystin-dependent protein
MANRTTVIGGIWADGAINVPDGEQPIVDMTYGKTGIGTTEIEAGWPYKKIQDASAFNEMMRRITTLLTSLEKYGILPWCPSTVYVAGALVFGSDAVIYKALSANTNKDPITETSYWIKYGTDPKLLVPTGTVVSYASLIVPDGWLECNGASVLISAYSGLYAVIGTTYGQIDGSHFTLPDLRGYFARGYDHTAPFGTHISDSIKAHTHNVSAFWASQAFDPGVASAIQYGASNTIQYATMSNAAPNTETAPKHMNLLSIIKY